MKKFYLSLLFTACFIAFTISQNQYTKKADDLYDDYAYTEAIDAYHKLLAKGKADRYIYTKLASSYYKLGDYKKAESFYARAVKAKNVMPEILYAYAQTLKVNGKTTEYQSWMQRFATSAPSDSRAQAFNNSPEYLDNLLSKEPLFTVSNAGDLNSRYSDYGSHINNNTLFFASARNTARKSHALNNEPFLDIYTATIDGLKIGPATLLPGDVNTKYHEGSVAITADGKRMYFDRNNYFEKDFDMDENGLNQINLYMADNVGGAWVNIQSAPFNSDNFSTGHPALSPDGKTLYFSSDRPGGKGGSDLYMVTIHTDGSFSEVQSLESNINTEGTEVFPFIASDGTLYFSSNGHLGLGALDIYYIEKKTGLPINAGKGVNSFSDDFGIYLLDNGLTGYISSNRKGGKGGDDIYLLGQVPPCDVDVSFTVKGPDGNGIGNATVTIININEETKESEIATTTGKYLYQSKCNRSYTIIAKAEGFKNSSLTLQVSKRNINTSLTLDRIDPVITETEVLLNPIYFVFDKASIIPSAASELDRLVRIMKTYPEIIISAESHTDVRGPENYNQRLSQRRANAMMEYMVSKGIDPKRISSIGKGESELAVDCGVNCTDEQHQKNRRSVFRIIQ